MSDLRPNFVDAAEKTRAPALARDGLMRVCLDFDVHQFSDLHAYKFNVDRYKI